MIVPPNMWFHQHFNTGTAPARYLAFKHEATSIRNEQEGPKAWIRRGLGGQQIDYAAGRAYDPRPDRTPGDSQAVCGGAPQARSQAAYGGGLQGGDGRDPHQGGV